MTCPGDCNVNHCIVLSSWLLLTNVHSVVLSRWLLLTNVHCVVLSRWRVRTAARRCRTPGTWTRPSSWSSSDSCLPSSWAMSPAARRPSWRVTGTYRLQLTISWAPTAPLGPWAGAVARNVWTCDWDIQAAADYLLGSDSPTRSLGGRSSPECVDVWLGHLGCGWLSSGLWQPH